MCSVGLHRCKRIALIGSTYTEITHFKVIGITLHPEVGELHRHAAGAVNIGVNRHIYGYRYA